jgi:hypothetical protein
MSKDVSKSWSDLTQASLTPTFMMNPRWRGLRELWNESE